MTGAEPSTLALFWAAVIAGAILVYVILDGFDLGVGILFGTTRDPALRERMILSISPYWDGNETWLVAVGAALYAAFPLAYSVLLPAFYLPLVLLLVALIFRGVAFEFRHQDAARGFWDAGFWAGSAVATFVQGAAVGAMIRGIAVVDGQYAGGSLDWLAPLPLLCGFGLMLGYALLGAGWLVLKARGATREWALQRLPWLAGGTLLVLAAAFVASLGEPERVGSNLIERPWGLLFPLLALLAMAVNFAAGWHRGDAWPFLATCVFFLGSFLTLVVLFWPYMIPYEITVADAAAPDASLSFLFWGAGVFVLPVIAIYTGVVYWVFRGKLRID